MKNNISLENNWNKIILGWSNKITKTEIKNKAKRKY